MRVHAGSTAHEGELPVHASSGGTATTPYAVIAFSPAFEVTVQSAEDCDRVTRAVARAKTMLGQIGAPHPFTPMARDGYRCDTCGAQNDKYHWKPEPEGLEDAAAQDDDEADDPFMQPAPMQDPAPVVRVIGGTCGEAWPADPALTCFREPGHFGQHAADPGSERQTRTWPNGADATEVERSGFIAADSPVLRGARIGGGQ